MTILNFDLSALPIDVVCVVLVLLAGLWQKKYLSMWPLSGDWKTLLVSFIVCALYLGILALCGEYRPALIKNYFFSYMLATALYRLLLKKWFTKLVGQEK